MKTLILCCSLVFSLSCFSQGKKKSLKGTLSLNKALSATGLSGQAFFEKYRKIISHNFNKDMNDPNYVMLRSFLRGVQDKEVRDDEEIVISVTPDLGFNVIDFNMYVLNNDSEIEHHEMTLKYQVVKKKRHSVSTIVLFEYSGFTEFIIKSGLVGRIAVPKSEVLTMRYDEQTDEVFYDVTLSLVSEVSEKVIKESFKTIFDKIEQVSLETFVPLINSAD